MSAAESDGATNSLTGTAASAAAGPIEVCTFTTRGDNAHISSTSDTRAAQAHGWWERISCDANVKAKVKVQMQIKKDGKWKNIGEPGKKTVKAGGGKGRRATGHVDCKNNNSTKWRSKVDVDIVGYADPDNVLTTPAVTLKCYA